MLEKTQVPKAKLDAGLIMLCKPGVKLLEKQIPKPNFESPDEVIKLNLKWTSNNILVKLVPIGAAKKKTDDPNEQENKL